MELAIVLLAAALVAAAIIVSRRPPAAAPAGRGPEAAEVARLLATEAEATRSLQARVDQSLDAISQMSGAFAERKRLEEQTTDAVRRIERLVAGSYSKGRVGENLLEASLSELPPEMVSREFRIGGRVCEFALRMDGGQVLPIDSKWPATDLVAQLEAEVEMNAREAIRRRVESEVCKKIKEVAGYIDPSSTVPLAVLAVPDQVYACCRKAHATARSLRVTVVSYSNAVPILLSIWQMHRAYASGVDERALADSIDALGAVIVEMNDKVEGHLVRGLKQASNAADDMRTLVAKARATVAGMKASPLKGIDDDDVDLRAEAV